MQNTIELRRNPVRRIAAMFAAFLITFVTLFNIGTASITIKAEEKWTEVAPESKPDKNSAVYRYIRSFLLDVASDRKYVSGVTDCSNSVYNHLASALGATNAKSLYGGEGSGRNTYAFQEHMGSVTEGRKITLTVGSGSDTEEITYVAHKGEYTNHEFLKTAGTIAEKGASGDLSGHMWISLGELPSGWSTDQVAAFLEDYYGLPENSLHGSHSFDDPETGNPVITNRVWDLTPANEYYTGNIWRVSSLSEKYGMCVDNGSGGKAGRVPTMVTWTREYVPPVVSVNFAKVGASTAAESERPHIAGATYEVYSDSECTSPVKEVVTTEGWYPIENLSPDTTYYYKELIAPSGWNVDETVKSFTTGAAGTEQSPVYAEDSRQTVILNLLKTDGENPVQGAKFEVRLSGTAVDVNGDNYTTEIPDNYLIGTFETDANGKISVDKIAEGEFKTHSLPNGVYTFTEVYVPSGYVLNNTPITFDASHASNATENAVTDGDRAISAYGKTVTVSKTFVNNAINVYFTKKETVGDTDVVLSGAHLALYKKTGEAVSETASYEWTSGTDDNATDLSGLSAYRIENMPAGEYVLKELSAPDHYRLITDRVITVENIAEQYFSITNEKYQTVVLNLHKTDGSMNPVQGAKFRVTLTSGGTDTVQNDPGTISEGYVIGEFTTDGNGLITIDRIQTEGQYKNHLLPNGTYTLTEIETPSGYVNNAIPIVVNAVFADNTTDTLLETQDGSVSAHGFVRTIDVSVMNTPMTAVFTKCETVSGERRAVSGAVLGLFEVVNGTASETAKYTWTSGTDDDCMDLSGLSAHFISNIDEGIYILRELETPSGYRKAADKEITIANTAFTQYFSLENTRVQTVVLNLHKTDGENPVPGAVYELYLRTDANDTGSSETPSVIPKDTLIGTYETDENGNITVSTISEGEFSGMALPNGTYEFIEKTAPEGYVLNDTPIVMNAGYVENGTGVVFTTDNGTISADGFVRTVNAETVDDIITAVFTKYETDENMLFSPVTGATLALYRQVGGDFSAAPAYTWTTGTDDNCTDLSNLSAYKIEKIPSGVYLLRELSAPDGYIKASDQTITIGNTAVSYFTMMDAYTKVCVLKTDKNGQPVIGAELSVKNSEGIEVAKWTTDGTDKLLTKLKPGTYSLEETVTPYGYQIAKTTAFTVLPLATTQYVTARDEETKGEIRITKLLSGTNSPLSGVKFELRYLEGVSYGEVNIASGDLFASGVTDENGLLTFTDIPIGLFSEGRFVQAYRYVLTEVMNSPAFLEGFTLDSDTRLTALEIGFEYADERTPVIEKEYTLFNARAEIGTTLESGMEVSRGIETEKYIAFRDEVTLIDHVSFKNLVKGAEYRLYGVLMDKNTGAKYLDKNNQTVECTIDFTPSEKDGAQDMNFTFMLKRLGSEHVNLVAYETLYRKIGDEYVEVASHRDLSSADQTVEITGYGTVLVRSVDTGTWQTQPVPEEEGTPVSQPVLGVERDFTLFIAFGAFSLAALFGMVITLIVSTDTSRKKKKQ